jgi:hypothetical protein
VRKDKEVKGLKELKEVEEAADAARDRWRGVYPPSLRRKESRNGMKIKEIDGISHGSTTGLQRDPNGAT